MPLLLLMLGLFCFVFYFHITGDGTKGFIHKSMQATTELNPLKKRNDTRCGDALQVISADRRL